MGVHPNEVKTRRIVSKSSAKATGKVWSCFFQRKKRLLSRVWALFFVVNMGKLRRLVYLSLLGALGILAVLLLPQYILIGMFGALALFFLARQLNFYKILMMLKRFIQNTRKLYFENRLTLRTGFRGYRDSELENSSRICR